METCFVSSTRRDTQPTFAPSSRPHGASFDLSVEMAGDALVEMAAAEIGDIIGDHSADDHEFAAQFPF